MFYVHKHFKSSCRRDSSVDEQLAVSVSAKVSWGLFGVTKSKPVSGQDLLSYTVHFCLLCSPLNPPPVSPDVAQLVKLACWLWSKADNARLEGLDAG